MSATIPHAAFVALLQGSGIVGINWATNPYYNEVPEPPPPFPYVVFELPESVVELSTEDAPSFSEQYKLTVRVVGLQAHVDSLISPYATTSVFHFLDHTNPGSLSGSGFKCTGWFRDGWELMEDKSKVRGPSGERVWVGSAPYSMLIVPTQ